MCQGSGATLADAGKLDSSAATHLHSTLASRLHWRLLPVLWLGMVLNVAVRSDLAFAELQMGSELNLSSSFFGLAAGIFFGPAPTDGPKST